MKAVTVYECEVCGRTHDNANECKICESSHIKPIEIVSFRAECGLFDYYPSYISIKFDNGEVRKYYWNRMD